MKKLLLALCLALSLPVLAVEPANVLGSFTVAPASTIQGVAGTATAITYTIYGVEQQGTIQTPKLLAQGQLATSTGVLYTAPAGVTTYVSTISLVNATGSAVSGVKMFTGGSAATNQTLNSLTIPANGQAIYNGVGWTVLDANGGVQTTIAGGITSLVGGTGINITGGNTINLTVPVALANGGTHADLSATGGTDQVLQQITAGANITVGTLACANLSNDGTACTANTGTSGATVPFLNGTNTWGAVNTFSSPPVMSGASITAATIPAASLVSTISAGGPTGSATVAPIITYNASGQLTTVGSATITPAVGSVTGLGTGVATALGTNVGTAGAFVVNGGALGTPSSGTLTNATGLPIVAGTTGTLTVTRGGTSADLSATGGASQVLKQASSGAAVTVGTLSCSDLSDDGSGCTATVTGSNTGDFTLAAVGSSPNANGATRTAQVLNLELASSSFPGLLTAARSAFLTAYMDKVEVLVTSNQYSNIACDGTTDDAAAWNALTAAAPADSVLRMPTCTSVIKSAITTAKHFAFIGNGIGRSIIRSTVNSADFLTVGDWYTTVEDIEFQGLYTSVTNAVALSGVGVSLLVGSTTGFPASGTFYVQTGTAPTTIYTLATYASITDSTHFGGVTAAASTTTAGGPITVKTGGYVVNAGSMTHIFLDKVAFTYVYNGFGSNGTICGISNAFIFQEVNFGIEFNGANVNSLVHNVTADGIPGALAHLEVKQAGSLLVSDSDLIRAQSNMRLNPTSPNGVFGVYVVNTYFDTALASSAIANSGNGVLIQGTGNVQRIKFVNSWLSSSAHSGLWANSTSSVLPTDIEVSTSNIYSNGVDGLQLDTIQDFIVQGNQISGNATAGIALTAGASAVTNGNIVNNQIGPAGGIGANGTGIVVAAGTYGNLSVIGNDLSGNTTASQSGLPGTVTAPNMAIIGQNQGLFVCPPSLAPALALPLTTVTEAGTSCAMRPGARIGSWARITVDVQHTATIATLTPSLHYGTANSNADATISSVTAPVAGTANAATCQYVFDFKVTSATTAMVTYKFYNGLGAAATTGCSTANVLNAGTVPATITNINTQAFLGVYFASSVNAINTIQNVTYEYGE